MRRPAAATGLPAVRRCLGVGRREAPRIVVRKVCSGAGRGKLLMGEDLANREGLRSGNLLLNDCIEESYKPLDAGGNILLTAYRGGSINAGLQRGSGLWQDRRLVHGEAENPGGKRR